jgi:23S rRNA (cytosine1962-C5)-methyltransferase
MKDTYFLHDSGDGEKLEQFGEHLLIRPSAGSIWKPTLERKRWEAADAVFSREKEKGWIFQKKLPSSWQARLFSLDFLIKPTPFGHVGLFAEHAHLWQWMEERISPSSNLLNLFAYTGGATMVAARKGASICHVDASSPVVFWASENVKINHLEKAKIRYIVDDVAKFLKREIKRGACYDGILLDPPTFGRGAKKEVFKIEQDLLEILTLCLALLSQRPLFLILSCHTPGWTPIALKNLLEQQMQSRGGLVEGGEMVIPSSSSFPIPSGSFARWQP